MEDKRTGLDGPEVLFIGCLCGCCPFLSSIGLMVGTVIVILENGDGLEPISASIYVLMFVFILTPMMCMQCYFMHEFISKPAVYTPGNILYEKSQVLFFFVFDQSEKMIKFFVFQSEIFSIDITFFVVIEFSE